MNTNTPQFTTTQSLVTYVKPITDGLEVWVQLRDGREDAYTIKDKSFRVREGHFLTAILHGQHPVAIRNDSTRMKIQLLTGEDVEGSAPSVRSRSFVFWFSWLVLIGFICPFAMDVIQTIIGQTLGDSTLVNTLYEFIAGGLWLAAIFGIPTKYIIQPRIRRAQHNRRIKAADRAIAKAFAAL